MTEIPGGSLTLMGVFLMGLGLNLTPCVYPMLSVTVSLFGSQKDHSRRYAFVRAIFYVLGIATMYSSLGVIAALTGGILGSFLQNSFVLIGIGLLLGALSLSMFGLYNLQAPSWLISKIETGKRVGLLGIYLSGLVVGIFAAPCVGPPVIALLTFVGTRRDVGFAFWTFFVMSLGLGLPYLILGTFSGLLRKLPKSGIWMIWVEHLFGVVLLVMAAFYLTIALFPQYLGSLPVMAFIIGGIYLGFLDQTGKESWKFGYFKKMAGTLAILGGFLLPLMTPTVSLPWEAYAPEKLAAAQASGKPVVMDFYADWCIPCHELDQFTYSNEQVVQALRDFVKLKVDLTHPDSPAALPLVERFNLAGVPTIVFLGPDGNEIVEARITGFVPPGDFIAIIRSLPFQSNHNTQKVPERGQV